MTRSGLKLSEKLSQEKTVCRVCTGADLKHILSLGSTPLANAFLKPEHKSEPEHSFPLGLVLCQSCGFAQLSHVVSPELLFRDYVYVSSTSPSFVAHFEELAAALTERFSFGRAPLVVDIGSNDGILLRPFKQRGWAVLGVDPAVKIAGQAAEQGIPTLPLFFTPELALDIRQNHGAASLVTATSVFPHIDDLDAVLEGVKKLLAPDGVFLVEAYSLKDLVEKNLFDTIYHEHLSYFTVSTLEKLFGRNGMEIFDVEKTDTHGGSLRVFTQKVGGPRTRTQRPDEFRKEEARCGLADPETYAAFAERIARNRVHLIELLASLKQQGKTIVGYGAPAKSSTLLNYFGIGPETLEYIVDDSAWKQGLLTPGSRIPVVDAGALERQKPDYVLILAWNFAEPIMKKLSRFRGAGSRFIVPVPEPVVV